MYKSFIYFVLFLNLFHSTAQEVNSLWETHFSYYNVNDLESNGPYIYASSDNSIFIYNTQTSELTKITTKQGLAGEAISSIYFSSNHNKLIVGFVNGLIQVIDFNTSNIFSIYDIIDKTTISPDSKRINNFNELDQHIYISTDYGISVFNLDSLEFGDTFFIGISGAQVRVAETTVLGEYFYAACKDFEGIKRSLISSNLIDFNNWSEVFSGSFHAILSVENSIYFSDQNKIYNIVNGIISEVFTSNEIIKDIRYISDSFIITTQNNTSTYDINFNSISTPIISSNFQTNFNAALFNSNNIYIATEDTGILKLNSNNIDNYTAIYPEGPLDNNIFSIENFNNDLWVTFGEYSLYYNPHPLKHKGISNYNSNWNNIVYDSLPSNSVNLNSISIDPFNNNHIFISSFHGGLLEIIDSEAVNLLDNTNSP
ncbi:MAG: ABC transporter substrate-binding protein, partial [Flavobacteriaceae bacterium]|nr:ABC transporter substrate-binding protein [Flavobacteriaceae bacterium]